MWLPSSSSSCRYNWWGVRASFANLSLAFFFSWSRVIPTLRLRCSLTFCLHRRFSFIPFRIHPHCCCPTCINRQSPLSWMWQYETPSIEAFEWQQILDFKEARRPVLKVNCEKRYGIPFGWNPLEWVQVSIAENPSAWICIRGQKTKTMPTDHVGHDTGRRPWEMRHM